MYSVHIMDSKKKKKNHKKAYKCKIRDDFLGFISHVIAIVCNTNWMVEIES